VPETDCQVEGFAEFVAGSLPALLRFGHVLTGSPQEAEDRVQEALAKSLRRWRWVRADNPIACTRRVMINTHLTRWRRWGARIRLGDVPESATDDAGLQRGEDWDALRRALGRLPPRQRAVLVLRPVPRRPSRHDDRRAAGLQSRHSAQPRGAGTGGLAAEADGRDNENNARR
jgi:DNA-directed RNA polymerase specialized sigma24 family protein